MVTISDSESLRDHFVKNFHRFCVGLGDLWWCECLTRAAGKNKFKRISLVNHSARTIHHHPILWLLHFKEILILPYLSLYKESMGFSINIWFTWQNGSKSVPMKRAWNIYNHPSSKSFCSHYVAHYTM